MRRWSPFVGAVLLLASCAKEKRDESGLPPAQCTAGTRWTPGTKAFQDATSKWGLDSLGVDGVRFSVADIDNDGWPDLIVRKVGVTPDGAPSNGTRTFWVLRNNHEGKFEDVTVSSGLLQTRTERSPAVGRPGEVVAFADVDNDGDLDAYTGLNTTAANVNAADTSEIMLNDGTGHFSFGPEESEARGIPAFDVPAGASFLDYDRDGNIDLWVAQGSKSDGTLLQNRLYRGDGTGYFTDVVNDTGIATKGWKNIDDINSGLAHTNSWSGTSCDLNGDGVPELLAASYGRAPNQIWQGKLENGAVTFSNRSVASGYAYDDNLSWSDNQFARCYCEANRDAEGCANVPPSLLDCSQINWNHANDREPFRLGGNSGATICADIDNDGDIDLMTSEIKHWWAGEGADGAEVLVNSGESEVRFTRPGRASMGIVVQHPSNSWDEGIMTGDIFDFDNDGWADLYMGASDYPGNHGLLFHQKSALQFEDVPIEDGIDHNRSHGIAVADFDRDGDLDVVVGHSTSRCSAGANPCYAKFNARFFENVTPKGNWVQLKLEGAAGTNRAAVGARITVKAGDVTQTKENGGGYGHFGAQDDLVQHIGLGSACQAEVTVRWPNGELQTTSYKLPAGYRFHLRQGEQPVVVK
jgi:hypothetical protein